MQISSRAGTYSSVYSVRVGKRDICFYEEADFFAVVREYIIYPSQCFFGGDLILPYVVDDDCLYILHSTGTVVDTLNFLHRTS